MTITDHPHVAGYLARFDAVSQALSPARRAELRTDLLEHLAEAIPADADDATVRHALDRLGPPEDILAAEQGPEGATPPAAAPAQRPELVREGLAVAFLTAGSFIPVIGWLVGAVLLWTSRRWRVGEKLAGTLIVPGGPGTVALVVWLTLLTPSQQCRPADEVPTPPGTVADLALICTSGSPQSVPAIVPWLILAALALGFLVPGRLYSRADRRARAA